MALPASRVQQHRGQLQAEQVCVQARPGGEAQGGAPPWRTEPPKLRGKGDSWGCGLTWWLLPWEQMSPLLLGLPWTLGEHSLRLLRTFPRRHPPPWEVKSR